MKEYKIGDVLKARTSLYFDPSTIQRICEKIDPDPNEITKFGVPFISKNANYIVVALDYDKNDNIHGFGVINNQGIKSFFTNDLDFINITRKEKLKKIMKNK